jgi:hypothetical protein
MALLLLFYSAPRALTLTVDYGSFTATGQEITFPSGKRLDAGAGAFTLTGSSCDFSYSGSVAPTGFWIDQDQVGTFKIKKLVAPVVQQAIIAPPTAAAYVLDAGAGAFTLTGSNTSFSYSGSVAPTGFWIDQDQVGTYKIKKLVAPVSQYSILATPAPTAHVLTAGTGSFALTGVAQNLLRGRRLTAQPGSFVLSGQAITFPSGKRLVAGTGSFVVSGQATGFLRSRVFVCNHGSFALTGVATSFLRGRRLTAQTGSFALTGQAITFPSGKRLVASSRSFVVTGSIAGFLSHRQLEASARAFTLTGVATGMRRNRLTGAAGLFVLSGRTVVLSYDRSAAYEFPTLNTTGFLFTEVAGTWTIASADLGDGFLLSKNLGLAEGRRSWTIRVDVLPGDYQGGLIVNDIQAPGFVLLEAAAGGYVLNEHGGRIILERAATRAAYLWQFFRNSKARGDQPFWIEVEDPETGTRQQYAANFVEDRLSYEILCAQIYGTGLELIERRLPPVTGAPARFKR